MVTKKIIRHLSWRSVADVALYAGGVPVGAPIRLQGEQDAQWSLLLPMGLLGAPPRTAELRAFRPEEFEAELALGEAAMQEFEADLPAMQELEQARLAAEAEKKHALRGATVQARGMEAGLSGEANKEAGLSEYRALKTALLTD